MKVRCIVNPASGGGRLYKAENRAMLRSFANHSYHETDNISELNDLVSQWDSSGGELLIIAGGDGTTHATLTALLTQQGATCLPMVALLPFGSSNLSALDLNGSVSLKDALSSLQSVLASPEATWPTTARPLLRIETAEKPVQFGFIFAIGIADKFVRHFQEKIKPLKLKQKWGILVIVINIFWRLLKRDPELTASVPIEITCDDQPVRKLNCSLAVASTLKRFFFRLHYHWSAGQPIYYTEVGDRAPRIISALFRILFNRIPGWLLKSDQYQSLSFTEAHLKFSGSFVLDGEIDNTRDGVKLSKSPAIKFLRLSKK